MRSDKWVDLSLVCWEMRLRSDCRDEMGGFLSTVSRWLHAVTERERERSQTVLRAVLM